MNDDLTWRFDVAVIEWLILLTMLVILAVVGAVVTRQTLNAFKKRKGRRVTTFRHQKAGILKALMQSSNHSIPQKTVYPEKRQLTDLLNTDRIDFPKQKHVDHWCGFSTSSTMY